ncbi:xanthine dehydrogenase family protein molybdopterin-binding subunit [Mycobacteroides abscessus]|uniref:xanthine dehydrogenase family protein molybdopterin-binding subunit n=1 Tax=Mycobacteroides abscessus TaxID=36809 RepID=UPI002102E02A|nr:xanthine dehydrogenase family protein molybdopterin-binding subunit [Mycobacteroides abscessus]
MTAQIGRSVSRVEGVEKITGAAHYTADTPLPGVRYAALVQSEIPHGHVSAASLEAATRQALAADGVVHVLTSLNCPTLQHIPHDLTWDLPFERRPPLSDLAVYYRGQHMAVVVADTLENAVHAASQMRLEYEASPAILTAQESSDTYQPDHFVKLTEEKLQDHRGPQEEPPGRAVAASFVTPENAHYPIELSATIAQWDGDNLTIHDSVRWISGQRRVLAAYFDIPVEQVHIIAPLVGGAFGSKSFMWMHVALCAVAARVTGVPVKLVLTRDQMFTSTGHRPPTEQNLRLVSDGSGRIASIEHHTLSATSMVAHFCEPAGLSTRFLYQSPRLAVTHTVARTHTPTPCFMRGPGEAPGLFALEVAMDELAYAVGIDPVQLRIANDAPDDQASGSPWSQRHLLDCYRQGAERFGWDRRPTAPRSLRRGGVQVGWGMATATYPGRRMAAGCRVSTTPDGRVLFASATHEVGNGVRTVMCQIAADASGMPLDRIAFASGDSHFPEAPYSGASQTTASVGSAVHLAAGQWKQRLLAAVAGDSGDSATTWDIRDGKVVGPDPARPPAAVSQILADAGPALLEQLTFTCTSAGVPESGPVSQSFGAHFCEVEVDEEIGRATVTRWVGVMDCGTVINPKLARNQVIGGITFGLGMALLEQVPYHPRTGAPLGEYYVPTHADVPEFDITFIESTDTHLTPFGARGIGEIGICGVPAAIANAIFHATGRRLRHLPITIEALLRPFERAEFGL